MTATHLAPITIALDPSAERDHERDFAALADRLERAGQDANQLIAALHRFEIALPSWAFATGGTRFGRFPGAGEPRTLREKMEDAAIVHRLTTGTPRLSLHIPWDEPRDLDEILADARRLGIGFDAVNSNTFQDQPGQELSYKFGSFSNPSAAVRRQAIDHHLQVIEIGKQVGSKALSVWLADGSNYPGQMSLRGSFERVRECLQEVYAATPNRWSRPSTASRSRCPRGRSPRAERASDDSRAPASRERCARRWKTRPWSIGSPPPRRAFHSTSHGTRRATWTRSGPLQSDSASGSTR